MCKCSHFKEIKIAKTSLIISDNQCFSPQLQTNILDRLIILIVIRFLKRVAKETSSSCTTLSDSEFRMRSAAVLVVDVSVMTLTLYATSDWLG